MRFKIDYNQFASSYIYALYAGRRGLFWMRWEKVDSFQTREEAIALHDKIKDLPQYL